MNCPLEGCEIPLEEHKGVQRVVHIERGNDQKNERRYGRNGGVICDTSSGPCSCGAWH